MAAVVALRPKLQVVAPVETAAPPGRVPQLELGQLQGRLSEVSSFGAAAGVSVAMQWVLEAQLGGELAAWVQVQCSTPSTFYAPDVAESGVDLSTLPVVFVRDTVQAARAAEQLLRSSGFALVVIDACGAPASAVWSMAQQSRLLGLAQKHDAGVVFLNEKTPEAPSIGSLVSLRLQTYKRKLSGDRFAIHCDILKDKRQGPGAHVQRIFRAPEGVR